MNVSGPFGSSAAALGAYDASSGASSIASNTDPVLSDMRSQVQQQTQNFQELQSALQSGDLSSAQSAFVNLQQLIQTTSQANGGRSLFDANGAIGNDFQSLGSALRSGDLTGAQEAFSSLRQAMRAARRNGQSAAQSSDNTTSTSSSGPYQLDALA